MRAGHFSRGVFQIGGKLKKKGKDVLIDLCWWHKSLLKCSCLPIFLKLAPNVKHTRRPGDPAPP